MCLTFLLSLELQIYTAPDVQPLNSAPLVTAFTTAPADYKVRCFQLNGINPRLQELCYEDYFA